MKLEKIEGEDKKLKFIASETSPAMMNAMRRVSMHHIPVLAVEDVGIIENSSPLFDEVIAQRLGQVPLVFDADKFDSREECDCEEGCSNCEARFTLKAEGPGKVVSGDLVSESGEVDVLYDKIPITILDENQAIDIEATAVLSTGKDHSKHQASISSYQYYPLIDIDQDDITEEEKKKVVEVCPRDVFKLKNGKLELNDKMSCTLCNECVETIESDGLVVTGDKERFIFKVESVSSHSPEEILKKTAEILDEKADKVIEKLS